MVGNIYLSARLEARVCTWYEGYCVGLLCCQTLLGMHLRREVLGGKCNVLNPPYHAVLLFEAAGVLDSAVASCGRG